MSKRRRRRQRHAVLRATSLPLAAGAMLVLGVAVFTDTPAAHKGDFLMAEPVVGLQFPIRIASLSDDWAQHLAQAQAAERPVRLAQSDTTGTQVDTTTTQAITPNLAKKQVNTELDNLALEAQLTKGYAHLARQDYKAAKEIFAEAVKSHGDRADLWSQLGYIDANLGNKSAAIEDFTKASELEPTNEQTKTTLEQMQKEAKLDKGYAALCEKDYKSAKDVFKEAIDKDADNPDLWRQLAYIELGLGNKDAALEAFEKTLALAPGDPQVEAEIEQIKYEPVLKEAYQKLADKDYAEALRMFQGAAQSQPQRSDLWKQIAFIQTNLGNSMAAAEAFDKSSDLDTARLEQEAEAQKMKIDAKLEEAYTALCSKDYDTARSAYMAAVEIDPMRADLWEQLGGVETNLGNIKAASEAFDRARALKPAN